MPPIQTKLGALCLQVALQGVPGIKKVSIRETKVMMPDAEAAEGFRNENTWVLDTEGTNLLDVRPQPSCCALHQVCIAEELVSLRRGCCEW
jgi:hypothetical protein